MRVLVAYATKNGGTAGIAQAVGEELKGMGLDTEIRPVKEVHDVRPFDAVVLGSGVYIGRWRREAVKFGERNAAELRRKRVWLFESGPTDTSADGGKAVPAKSAAALAQEIGAQGHVIFGGRLRPEDVGGFTRKMVEKAAGTTNIFGDWRNFERVRAWARTIAANLRAMPQAGPREESLSKVHSLPS